MAEKILYSKKLGDQIARAAANEKRYIKYHIIPWGENFWKVVPNGKLRSIKNFTTKGKATLFAKTIARKRGGEVVVHTPEGRIENRLSFATAS